MVQFITKQIDKKHEIHHDIRYTFYFLFGVSTLDAPTSYDVPGETVVQACSVAVIVSWIIGHILGARLRLAPIELKAVEISVPAS